MSVPLEQLVEPVGEEADIAEIAIDLFANGPSRSFRPSCLTHPVHGELGERLEARLGAGVLAQPDQCRPPPLLRHLIVEQRAQAVEDRLGRVDVRQQQLLADVEAAPLLSTASIRISSSWRTSASFSASSRRCSSCCTRSRLSRARVGRPALRSVIWSSKPSRPSGRRPRAQAAPAPEARRACARCCASPSRVGLLGGGADGDWRGGCPRPGETDDARCGRATSVSGRSRQLTVARTETANQAVTGPTRPHRPLTSRHPGSCRARVRDEPARLTKIVFP